MHRIDGTGATIDNHFTEGNPALSIPATVVTDDIMNDIQDNICVVIENAGIALVKGDVNQLYNAILILAGFGGNTLSMLLANNQGAPADITGLVFDKVTIKSVQFDYEIYRQTDSNNEMEAGTGFLSYRTATSAWEISQDTKFDESGVTLSVTSGGQVQYVSTNLVGTSYAGKMRVMNIRKLKV